MKRITQKRRQRGTFTALIIAAFFFAAIGTPNPAFNGYDLLAIVFFTLAGWQITRIEETE